MEAADLRVEPTVRSEATIPRVNGPWLLGYGTAAQNPAPAITRTGAIGRGYRSPPFAAPVRAPRPASEQLLDRLELEEEQPEAGQGRAPHRPAGPLPATSLAQVV